MASVLGVMAVPPSGGTLALIGQMLPTGLVFLGSLSEWSTDQLAVDWFPSIVSSVGDTAEWKLSE